MLRIASFSLLIIVQVVVAEPPPPHCTVPPSYIKYPWKCCDFPILFKDEDLEECDLEKHSNDDQYFKKGTSDCSNIKCLLNKHKLMKDDEEIDNDAVMEFLDKWVEANPDYKDAVEKAKEHCLKSKLPYPEFPCGPKITLYCIKMTLFLECPKWEDTDNCKKLKEYLEKCIPYFVKG